MPKIEFTETEELPVCPYCEKELGTVNVNRTGFWIERQKVYQCPYCKKVLGVAFDRSG